MSVPAVIEAILAKHDIKCAIIEAHPNTNIQSAAKTSILQDSQGKLQAIYSADSILDVDALRRLTDRELKATSPEDIDSLCSKAQLDRPSCVPGVMKLNMVIDQRLLDSNSLQLDSGSGHSLVPLSSQQFTQLFGEARSGNITVAEADLQTGPLDDAQDVEQITIAVANFTQLRIKQRLEETLEFPPLPETAQRIIKLQVDPNADIQDLASIVESDPALAAQVVSWAASPYYAAPGKIKSVHDAIVRVLGFDLVLNLSLGLALGKTMSLPKDGAKGFTPYWQQAVYAATAVEALVSAIPPKERPVMGMAYLSGLLHNFGYLMLAQLFPPQFSNVCRYQEANPFANHSLIERHLLGVTREQLGSWLMKLCLTVRTANTPSCYLLPCDCYAATASAMLPALKLMMKYLPASA
jgi:HD-like signal output (HDOD) protein/prolyl-tRNA editing enzyme YbaK/EbsC (Cys-tRNA(Pro) deacylase)